jgi:peptidoglycan/xylan/chitin deacetylase (PgdA/CDA1 family)
MHGLILFLTGAVCLAAAEPRRAIALTFDDLPMAQQMGLGEAQQATGRILAALKSAGAPAVGFVNENKLDVPGERDRRLSLLRSWVDAGHDLGNHTYSHPDLNSTPLLVYQNDILKGERLIRPMMKSAGRNLRWFRHPYTHTGPTQQIKFNLELFLKRKGYMVAPFTIENSDWLFSSVWHEAVQRGDRETATRIRDAYLDFTDIVFGYFERATLDQFGRDIPQVLLLHANPLNAEVLPELLDRIRARGYRFVSLGEAVSDSAYETRDGYVGKHGPSYIHRWAQTRGLSNRQRDEPDPPAWISQMSRTHETAGAAR